MFICINGPRYSGKTSLANALAKALGQSHLQVESFSRPFKLAAEELLRDIVPADAKKDDRIIREFLPEQTVSIREVWIEMAERLMKPIFGKSVFARALLGRIDRSRASKNPFVIIDDLGFQEELDYLVGFGGRQVVVIQLSGEFGSDDVRSRLFHEGKTMEMTQRSAPPIVMAADVIEYIYANWPEAFEQ